MENNIIEIQQEQKKLLPAWARILLLFVVFFILTGLFQYIGFALLGVQFKGLESLKDFTISQLLIMESCTFLATFISVFIFRKYVDKQSFISLGFETNGITKNIVVGFAVAVIMFTVGTIILYLSKELFITGYNFNFKTTFLSFILCIIIALNEELLVRGYILNNLLASIKNKYVALVISSLIFASMHLLNFNATFLSIFNIFLAGIILGSVYIFTKNLWFSISLHLFWNFLQGPILGYHVSGFNLQPLLIQKLPENNFINGGEFGFEGSILCSILTIIFSFIIIKSYQNNKQLN